MKDIKTPEEWLKCRGTKLIKESWIITIMREYAKYYHQEQLKAKTATDSEKKISHAITDLDREMKLAAEVRHEYVSAVAMKRIKKNLSKD